MGKQQPSARLILIIGPSGSGKDTLIQNFLIHQPHARAPKRHITRTSQKGEDCYSLNETEFLDNLDKHYYCLYWYAHGLHYGIPADILTLLQQGHDVIINISRSVVDKARELWDDSLICYLHVSTDVLKQRLLERGRETAAEIGRRLIHHDAWIQNAITLEHDVLIDTSGSPQNSLQQLLDALSIR